MFSRNLAFIIGINNYTNGISPLKTAVNDAKKLVETLREKHGYQVWVCLDEVATLSKLNQFLENKLPQKVRENDRLLFYFAGHGVALNGDDGPAGYLIPQDAKRGDIDSYLPMTKLHDALSKLPCRHFLGILDCCFAGAFRWSSTRDLLTEPEVIHKERYDRFITDAAWQIITSSASDQKALDNFKLDTERGQVGNHSPFAAALLKSLEGEADTYPPAKNKKPAGDGVITATELYLHLRDTVEIPTEKHRLRQTPSIWCLNKHDKGEYIFLSPGHELNLPPAPPLDESKNPYRGLKSFEEKHSELFFGRSELVEKLQDFVKTHPLTVVLGASGSGKSSLVKAGLIPNLKKETNDKWCILSPIRPGETPFQALNNALVGESLPKLELQNQQKTLAQSIAVWVKNNPNSKLLIVIDQSEELITLCQNENERKEFFQQILTAINHHRHQLRVVLTLRSDFEPQVRDAGLKFVCEELNLGNTFLQRRWQSGRFIVPAMTRGELRQAIEKPAETRVMYFEPHELVEEFIDEVDNMPGALPLLSFALRELFLKYLQRQHKAQYEGITIDRALTQADYEELGGVMQSLTQRADEEYERLVNENLVYEQVIRHVMLRMVALTGGELARRRVLLSELEYPPKKNILVKEVIECFTQARLLVKGEDAQGNCYVEPAHDALVRGWEKLQTWLTQEKNLSLQRRLTPSALEWNHQRQVKFLWNANPYLDVLDKEILFSPDNNWLNQVETEFVRQSIRQKRKNRITRWTLVSTAFLLLSSATGIAINFAIDAQNKFLEASSTSADSMFNSGRELDALVKATETGESLKNTPAFVINEKNRIQVIDTLRKIVYGIKESNRLLTNKTKVISVSYSPDGQMLTSINEDGIIRLWRHDGKLVKKCVEELENNDNSFKVRFSADGKNLISASNKQGIRIWQRQTDGCFNFSKKITTQDKIKSLAVSPDFQKIAASSFDTDTVRLWSTDGKFLRTLGKHRDRVNDLSFSQDSQTLASASADGTVKLWNLKNTEQNKTIQVNRSAFLVRFLNRHTLAVADDEETIKVWNVNGTFEKEFVNKDRHVEEILDLALSPDGKTIASASRDYTIKIWRIEDQKILHTLTGHTSNVNSVSFYPNNKKIASASPDGSVRIWNLDNQVPTLEAEKFSFSPDNSTIATVKNKTITLWTKDFKFLKTFPTHHDGQQINKISFSHNGKIIASASDDKTIKLWDLNGTPIKTLKGHKKSVTSIAFSPDDKTIASGSHDDTVKLWNSDGILINTLQRHQEEVTSIAFSPDGKIIASGSNDNTVKLWSSDGILIKTLRDRDDVLDISFIPVSSSFQVFDKLLLASASEDKNLKLWYLNGREFGVPFVHEDRVNQLKFSPNSNILATVTDGKTIKLWNLQGELLSFDTEGYIWDINFSSDGKKFAYATEQGKVTFWNLDLSYLLKRSCRWLGDYRNHSQNYKPNSQIKLCTK